MDIEKASFIGLLLVVSAAFVVLLFDFLQPVFWAATLAVLFHPAHRRLMVLLKKRRTPAALLTLLLICITVLLPAWFISAALVNEASTLYKAIQSGEIDLSRAVEWLRNTAPAVTEFLAGLGITPEKITESVSSAAVVSGQYVGSMAVTTGQNIARFSINFLLMIYILFFFIREGERLLEILIIAMPFGDARERALLTKFAEVSRATVKGTLVIGLIQGGLGGLIFWMLGIQGAVFWGAVMVVLSLIPVVGASFVWAPAAIIMLASGEYIDAAILVVFGVLVIGLVDNVLRPILVGRDTRMPDYLVLLSTLGGLSVFGPSGIVMGPIIAALFLAIWVMFAEEHAGRTLHEFLDRSP
ncbi:MAG: AI-2E family transporter [Gammaproteobacteria bacterium]|nr:AI-2E family transporter [Gammaproteobacteria bacterium]